MVAKLGEAQTFMLEQGLSTQRTHESNERKRVYDAVGGEDAWTEIAAWTASDKSSITKEQESAYNSMLAQGGEQAVIAAQKIKEAYMSDPNTTIPANNALQGDTGVPPVGGLQPISRAEYLSEKKAAVNNNDAVAVDTLEKRAKFTMAHHESLWRPQGARF